MKTPGESLILCLALCLSALLLAMSLRYDLHAAVLNDEAVRDKAACLELTEEVRRLRVRCCFSVNLEEIDRAAREELGMQSLSAEQIVRATETLG